MRATNRGAGRESQTGPSGAPVCCEEVQSGGWGFWEASSQIGGGWSMAPGRGQGWVGPRPRRRLAQSRPSPCAKTFVDTQVQTPGLSVQGGL